VHRRRHRQTSTLRTISPCYYWTGASGASSASGAGGAGGGAGAAACGASTAISTVVSAPPVSSTTASPLSHISAVSSDSPFAGVARSLARDAFANASNRPPPNPAGDAPVTC
jgi:hypothetical protein